MRLHILKNYCWKGIKNLFFFFHICKFTYYTSKETGAWTLARELEDSSCQYRQLPWYLKGRLNSPDKTLNLTVLTVFTCEIQLPLFFKFKEVRKFISFLHLFLSCLTLELCCVHFHVCWRKTSVLFPWRKKTVLRPISPQICHSWVTYVMQGW